VKRLIQNQRGSISIYLIILIVPIFLFNAVFIDYARIKLAEKETESAAKAAIRSTFSAYDQELKQIGLWGLSMNHESATQIFEDVFAENLSGNHSSASFSFISPMSIEESTRFTPGYMLANHKIMNQQILEEMKYKAPIELALEITDKFTKNNVTDTLKAGSSFSKGVEKIESLIEKRDDELEEAWELTEDLYIEMEKNNKNYNEDIQDLSDLAKEIGITDIVEMKNIVDQLTSQIQTLNSQIKEMEDKLKLLNPLNSQDKVQIQRWKDTINAWKAQRDDKSTELSAREVNLNNLTIYMARIAIVKTKISLQQHKLEEFHRDIESSITKAKKLNQELRDEIKKEKDSMQSSQMDISEVYSNIPVVPDDFFDGYITSIGTIRSMFNRFGILFNESLFWTVQQTTTITDALDKCWEFTQDVYQKQKKEHDARIQRTEEIEQKKDDERNKIKDILNLAKKVTGDCISTKGQDKFKDEYGLLENPLFLYPQGYYQKYLTYNLKQAPSGSELSFELNEPDEVSTSSMDLMDVFTNTLGNVRNEIYLNEFALSRFTYRTLELDTKVKDHAKDNDEWYNLSSHSLKNQEVEYLIYGLSSCTANISAAYGEMFAFRMAIRTIEALLQGKNLMLSFGSPFLTLLAAAAQGAVLAYQDMNDLIAGKEVELMSKQLLNNITLNYKDYLRIFLLMHSKDMKLLARMQALIELNTKQDLTKVTAYAQGQASSSLRLWFLPAIVKGLEKVGLSSCKVIKNNCVITKIITWAY
jgi:hypothetical protein